jgi:DNA polymerase I
MNNANKVLLIDGSGYIFRAYYAVAPLTTKSGFPTNALFGYSRMLLKLLRDAGTDHIVVAFDRGKDTFRTQMYPQYKANREACPEDLLQQMPYFREISEALGLKIVEQDNFEADDLIGTLTKRLHEGGYEVEIISGDKDLMQLVAPGVSVYDSMRDKRYSAPEVREKLGVLPEQVIDFLALTGDSSDNVPGIKGVGPKTAVQLLEIFGSVDAVASSAEQIAQDSRIRGRAKIAEAIKEQQALLALSKELVTIKCDCPVAIKTSEGVLDLSEIDNSELLNVLTRQAADYDKLTKLSQDLEFKGLFKDHLSVASQARAVAAEYQIISKDKFSEWLKVFAVQDAFVFDIETTALDPRVAKIVGLSFCWSENEAFYVPINHQGEVSVEQCAEQDVLNALRPIFENANIKKIGQNLKFDVSILAEQGVKVAGVAFDTMLASYCLNPDSTSHSLATLAESLLGRPMISYTELVGKLENFSFVPLPAAAQYACEDAHFTWLIWRKLQPKLDAAGVAQLFYELEMPLLSLLAEMELAGIGVDAEFLRVMSEELGQRLSQLEQQIYNTVGQEFNINSPKQLSEILFNQLGISTKGLKKTKTGISTDSNVLEKIAGQHPVADMLLSYRMLHKLKSTYVDALPQLISAKTGRLHTRFNQTGTGTGRLSSSDPNLQNIPVQSVEGRKIRRAFIPAEGHVLLSADYSQIELRVLAHLSDDPQLITSFKDNLDIHSITAREILDLPPLFEITPEARRIGKTINFGIIYGMGAQRLSRELGIPLPVAAKYIDNYFKLYSGVQSYFARVEKEAADTGVVRTLLGRQRVVSDLELSSRDPGRLRRIAINAPVQGSAADIIKLAMLAVQKEIQKAALPMRILLQIHDELLLEVRRDYAPEALSLVKKIMENAFELKVPLSVDASVGENWEEVT